MKNRVMVFDSETCNIQKLDKVKPGNNLIYDFGYSVVEPATGLIIKERSYIVREIFFGEVDRMKSAYYANKLPGYYADIAQGKREIKSFAEIMVDVFNTCKSENVIALCAHNAKFDVDAVNTTFKWLYGFYARVFENFEIWDSMKMAKTFADTPTYRKFCQEHGYMTRHKPPRVQMKAETLYRFITNNPDFVESHTAFEDTMIEREILIKSYQTHKKMDRVLFGARG